MNTKVSIALAGIGITIAIVLIGWIILSAASGIIGTNNAAMQNTTSAMSSSNTIYGISGVVAMVAVIMGIIVTLSYFASSQRNYDKLGKIADFLIDSVYYFAFGLLAVAIIVVPGYLIYLLYNYAVLDGQAGNVLETLKWIGIIVGGFFAISGIGYLFKKKLVDKYIKLRRKHTESRKEIAKAT